MEKRGSAIVFYLEVILFMQASSTGTQHDGVQCSGYCTDDVQKCKSLGGRIMSFCTNSLACCDPLKHSTAKCGDVKSGQKIVEFKSPGYPAFGSGDLNCQVKIDLLKDNVATRVDFIQAEMDGPSFAESDENSGHCESDLVFLRGFETWSPPPRCGNLSGYSFLIDGDTPQTKTMKSLTILALMASPAYRWHIRVIQILKGNKRSPSHQNSVYGSEIPVFNKGKRSLLNPLPEKMSQPHSQDLDQAESDVNENFVTSSTEADLTEKKQSKFVLNGEDTLITIVPWQVSFRYKLESLNADEVNEKLSANCSINEGFHFCGGSIIGENFLLTASHCFYGTSKTNGMVDLAFVKAVLGDTNLCRDSENDKASFDYDIESVTMHYGYDSNLLINDIAVVKLKSRIEFMEHIKPIRLAKTGDDYSETVALLSGWGDYLKIQTDEDEDDGENNPPSSSPPPLMTTTMRESTENTPTTSTTISPPITTGNVQDVQNNTTPTTTPIPSTTTPPSFDINETLTSSTSTMTPITVTSPPSLTSTTFPTFMSSTMTPVTSPPSLTSSTSPFQNVSSIQQDTTFILETPSILQSSRRFLIQNRTVCEGKDVEQYSASKDNVLQYVKYFDVFNSTLCTLSVIDGEGSNYRPVSTGKGDSGGGLVYGEETGDPVQVGVVSYGIADSDSAAFCNSNKAVNRTFDFFSSVAFYRSWIDLVVLSHDNYSHV